MDTLLLMLKHLLFKESSSNTMNTLHACSQNSSAEILKIPHIPCSLRTENLIILCVHKTNPLLLVKEIELY